MQACEVRSCGLAGAEWARKAVKLYRKWNANKIVAETNQGGDMIEATIRMYDATVPFSGTHRHTSLLPASADDALAYQGNMERALGRTSRRSSLARPANT
jgi:phage terminase large subunit-like protein